MLPRILEPEVLDTAQDARDYDAMDHSHVNARFVTDFLAFHGTSRGGNYLDVGTGTARIPILLAKADENARIVALDLAEEMLVLARRNILEAGLESRVFPLLQDAKAIPRNDFEFEAVVSNSIIHHIPEPSYALSEMVRLTAPGGTLFLRDLERPENQESLDRLVQTYAGQESEEARSLFRNSLHAALTLDELTVLTNALGIPRSSVSRTSDRHWTLAWHRPIL